MTHSQHAFSRLAPFIQDYIYRHKWNELRPVQIAAAQAIFDTDSHLLLASATASGKTEAAFFPILTLLSEQPSTSVGVLYIGPLKALINDQFQRLELLLNEAEIPVWPWHGDVSQTKKSQLLKRPSGILQITPESLESMLMNRSTQLGRLFSDLRFVVIDEVHAFIGTDRGGQVLCLLQRLARYTNTHPRRIGLSATLGDYTVAQKWLAAGTDRPVFTPDVGTEARTVRIAVEHFYELGKEGLGVSLSNQYVYEASRDRKALIFANRRDDVEHVVADLRQITEREGLPDTIFAHHGSISAPLREVAEQAMREPDRAAVVAATVTLELGIDIGQLERVIQLDAPGSVASFVQRLGRSGRGSAPAEMWFVCRDPSPQPEDVFLDRIPWGLLQSIAIIELYREERFIESREDDPCPYSLLYHQTMSTLASCGELTPRALAQRVLTLSPFSGITQEDYRILLRHLLLIDHIQETESRGLIIGLNGERVVRDFHFYAVFPYDEEFRVVDGSSEIGTIPFSPPIGERFALAGQSWVVVDLDEKGKSVYVKKIAGKASISFLGQSGDVHERIVQRVRRILQEEVDYPYLQRTACERLSEARMVTKTTGLVTQSIVEMGGNQYAILPWVGSKAVRTLGRYIRQYGKVELGLIGVEVFAPYYIKITTSGAGVPDVAEWIRRVGREDFALDSLIPSSVSWQMGKYDAYIPEALLRKAFVANELEEWI